MSLALYGVPDGQQNGQSVCPCPSVYSPTTAHGSRSSVALSTAPARGTLTQHHSAHSIHRQFPTHISSEFLNEATNLISSGFLSEATGNMRQFENFRRRRTLRELTKKLLEPLIL